VLLADEAAGLTPLTVYVRSAESAVLKSTSSRTMPMNVAT
jgi:hypothetical protein